MADKALLNSPQVAAVGSRLRKLRKERGVTQADLARHWHPTVRYLRMEKGEYRVSLDKLFKILTMFDLDLADFFGDKVEDDTPSATTTCRSCTCCANSADGAKLQDTSSSNSARNGRSGGP